MTTTTIDHRSSFDLLRPAARIVVAAVVFLALLVAAYAVGRTTAPTKIVRTAVSAPVAESCHVGRPC